MLITSNPIQTPDEEALIGIYPNPARQTIYITIKSENQAVELINSVGKVVLRSPEYKNRDWSIAKYCLLIKSFG